MFTATVLASKLRDKMAYYFDMVTGNDVVQILHKNKSPKVLMTQEHYMNLLSRLSLYEKVDKRKTGSSSVEELTEQVMKKVILLEPEKKPTVRS